MRHLFTPRGEAALARVLALRPLLAFDLDGTLAPIVAQPAQARVPTGVAQRLQRLARVAPTAVVSGRSVADLRQRLGFAPHYLVGNHGAEDPAAMPAATSLQVMDALRGHLQAHADALASAGVVMEDKRLSFALHYRLAPSIDGALAGIGAVLQSMPPGVRVVGGKAVVNLLAAGAPDKGDAVETLVRRAGAGGLVFLGDDLNDEAVFARSRPQWLTVRVGREDRASRADYGLDGISEVPALLDRMLAVLAPMLPLNPAPSTPPGSG